ncbi:MAG: CmcJ/NvfI family oxidoreductase [Pseudomonadota bacterium]|nr:CmcJ/NvfI family oxidoreductase [Pseudomonadota bacterium]MEC7537941.1 CmcJ/NvfI family oxidoreductase [Pseudomonadota bacterium]MEC8200523.1 CmcJ/NvfI family oxidoreductase [Pseudomonadota bacterium]MEC8372896.1 CmcJ/NvfI family oxidoreductase [Pseudomonadota bacterium]MEC8698006.1 CmcJ/NvfI family oxidoreductase [Pseudomonadota bacterium]
MNSLVSESAEHTVPAKVRYINAEWKGKDNSPRIGSRESRRANTSFQDVRVHNARPRLEAGELTLDKNGFTLTQHHSAVTNFRDDNELERVYHKEMEALICRVTGADHCFARSHLIRTEKPIDFNDGYARFVHCDYNMKRLQEMSETVLETRGVEPQKNWIYVWYNTWQPFDHTVENNPLAFIDWESLPLDDVIDYYYTGRNNDSLVAAPVHSETHKWCYFPGMTTNEVIVLKQMDGRTGERSVYCPHTSFDFLEQDDDSLPRRSVETRLLAVFEAN